MSTLKIRELQTADTVASATLHREVLDMEFLARCGPRFLRRYHRAWIESPTGLALAAVDERGRVVGVLLGTLDPAAHVRTMVRRHGLPMALWLAARAVTHPSFGREIVATRSFRYLRGLARILTSGMASAGRRKRRGSPGEPDQALDTLTRRPASPALVGQPHMVPRSGEITHLMVQEATRGGGVGRALLEEARRAGQRAGLDEFVLVTPPDLVARDFYEHLGWRFAGELTSRSGESFVRYRWSLAQSAD